MGSLQVPLNEAVIDLVASPMLTCGGVILVGMLPPWGWGTDKGGLPVMMLLPQVLGLTGPGLQLQSSGLLGMRLWQWPPTCASWVEVGQQM